MTTALSMGQLVVAIDIPCAAWREALVDAEARVTNAITASLRHACPTLVEAEVSVVLVDDATQRVLNETWRDKDKATNVLSFPATDTVAGTAPQPEFAGVPLALGDISLAFETIRAEAITQHKTLGDHLSHLVVHGVLHLLGYDHIADADAAVMESLEIQILAELGLSDPYLLVDERGSER